jgi:hypothetical protein
MSVISELAELEDAAQTLKVACKCETWAWAHPVSLISYVTWSLNRAFHPFSIEVPPILHQVPVHQRLLDSSRVKHSYSSSALQRWPLDIYGFNPCRDSSRPLHVASAQAQRPLVYAFGLELDF